MRQRSIFGREANCVLFALRLDALGRQVLVPVMLGGASAELARRGMLLGATGARDWSSTSKVWDSMKYAQEIV
eukprot:6188718-Pleurochrysis_carterae.AAC.2